MVEQKNHNLKVRGSIPLFINTGMVKLVDTLVLETNNFGYTGSTPVTFTIIWPGTKLRP